MITNLKIAGLLIVIVCLVWDSGAAIMTAIGTPAKAPLLVQAVTTASMFLFLCYLLFMAVTK